MPPLRDVSGLKKAAAEDSALSMALDSVGTWCFDPTGNFSGGWKTPKEEPSPDCARAIAGCEKALSAVQKNAESHQLDDSALADMERPYGLSRYTLKRAGVRDRPSEAVDCRAKSKSQLFAQAQQRMEKSRVHAQVLAEYGDYRAWLFAEGIKCKNAVAEARRKGTKVTGWVQASPHAGAPAAAPSTSAGEGLAAAVADAGMPAAASTQAQPGWKEQALQASMAEKWKLLAARGATNEVDRDYKSSFLHSKEVRGCGCSAVNAAAIARSIEKKEGGPAGMALLEAEDGANTKCALCWLEAFDVWKERIIRQCSEMTRMSEFELNKLEQSDDGPSIPRRCFDEVRDARAATQKLAVRPAAPATAAPVSAGGASAPSGPAAAFAPATARGHAGTSGAPTGSAPASGSAAATGASPATRPATASGTSAAASPASADRAASSSSGGGVAATGAGASNGSGGLVDVDGYTYYRPPQKPVSVPTPTPSPSTAKPSLDYDAFVPPQSYAPIPPREEGRLYVRISMSSACVAEILPGPIHARNGDLIVVPLSARSLEVKSPCGGVAEIYFGKEPAPRISEIFGRNQPVSFVFKPE